VTDAERTPLAPPDRVAALAMWAEYSAACPAPVAAQDAEPDIGAFGDHVELADELLDLVVHGRKRATAGLVADYVGDERLPRIGGHWVVCDGSGVPRVVLRSTELRIGVIESVDDAFAWDEGEGDRSRDHWLAAHRDFFGRTCAARGAELTEDLEVVFERFRLVWPAGLAD
jgi:uncharacterized protein YhfF